MNGRFLSAPRASVRDSKLQRGRRGDRGTHPVREYWHRRFLAFGETRRSLSPTD